MIPVQQERIVLPVQPVLLIRSASTSPKSKTPPESIHSTWVKGHPGQTLLDNFYFACAPLNFCVKVNSSASNCSYIWTSAYRSFMAIQAIVYNFKYHWSLWESSASDNKIPHCVLQFEVDEEKRIMYIMYFTLFHSSYIRLIRCHLTKFTSFWRIKYNFYIYFKEKLCFPDWI